MATYTTLAAARTAYNESTDYADGSGDITKARIVRSALNFMMANMPQQASKASGTVTMDTVTMRNRLEAVETWLADHDCDQTSPAVGTQVVDVRQIRSAGV